MTWLQRLFYRPEMVVRLSDDEARHVIDALRFAATASDYRGTHKATEAQRKLKTARLANIIAARLYASRS